jgi:hypothetical protein
MNEPKEVIIDRRHQPELALKIGKREYDLAKPQNIIALGTLIVMLFTFGQFTFKVLDIKLGRGLDAKVTREIERATREDSISHIQRDFLMSQTVYMNKQIQGLTLVVCAAVSDKSSTLTRIKCDEALRSSASSIHP